MQQYKTIKFRESRIVKKIKEDEAGRKAADIYGEQPWVGHSSPFDTSAAAGPQVDKITEPRKLKSSDSKLILEAY